MRLRRLNEKGLVRFGAFLDSLTSASPHRRPVELLSDADTSEPVHPSVEIEQRNFSTRLDAARYLHESFANCGVVGLDTDRGLWAWLALFYFDQLCPPDKRGNRKPGKRARWIPAFSDARRYYRHLLAGPYRIFKAHRDAPERAMVLLYGPLGVVGHFYYQLASRQKLVTNKAIVALATEMYIDPETQSHKRGAQTDDKPGTLRRFVAVLDQLDTTWDLYAMSKDQIAAMLPQEFNRFLKAGNARQQTYQNQ